MSKATQKNKDIYIIFTLFTVFIKRDGHIYFIKKQPLSVKSLI